MKDIQYPALFRLCVMSQEPKVELFIEATHLKGINPRRVPSNASGDLWTSTSDTFRW